MKRTLVLSIAVFVSITSLVSAEVIRNGIDIDFVTIGNTGNAPDTQVMTNDNTTGYGAVSYDYRIGKYEVTNAQWNAFTVAAGAPTGNDSDYSGSAYDYNAYFTDAQQPTNRVSWYEAAQFCNYLTSGDKSKGAYQFSGTNTNPGNFLGINRNAAFSTYGIAYVIPTEDEWYKAAYYKPDGSGYSLYANGLNTIPAVDDGWNYAGGVYSIPWNVGTGIQEQNGTFDMMGNVYEWNESSIYGEWRPLRGLRAGSYNDGNYHFASSFRGYDGSVDEDMTHGFRVASVPEPASVFFFVGGICAFLCKRSGR